MTTTEVAAPPERLWVSLEGVEGVGKTHLAARLARELGPAARLIEEISDAGDADVPGRVFAALAANAGRDPFLRGSAPRAETFALLALVVRRAETLACAPEAVRVVVEDRGIDSVALYQAAILAGPDADDEVVWELAERLLGTATSWRRAPDVTVLLVDDLEACAERWTRREGSALTGEQRALVARAARLYERAAAADPGRFRVLDRRGLTEAQVAARALALITAAAGTDRSNRDG